MEQVSEGHNSAVGSANDAVNSSDSMHTASEGKLNVQGDLVRAAVARAEMAEFSLSKCQEELATQKEFAEQYKAKADKHQEETDDIIQHLTDKQDQIYKLEDRLKELEDTLAENRRNSKAKLDQAGDELMQKDFKLNAESKKAI